MRQDSARRGEDFFDLLSVWLLEVRRSLRFIITNYKEN